MPQLFFSYFFGISRACLGHISGISWAYIGNISGTSWAYLGHILGIYREHLGHIIVFVRHSQLAEVSRSEFDPEVFSHHAYVKFFVTFATAPNGLFIFYGPSQYFSSFSSLRPKSKKISFSRISIATCKKNCLPAADTLLMPQTFHIASLNLHTKKLSRI